MQERQGVGGEEAVSFSNSSFCRRTPRYRRAAGTDFICDPGGEKAVSAGLLGRPASLMQREMSAPFPKSTCCASRQAKRSGSYPREAVAPGTQWNAIRSPLHATLKTVS